jgi:hypothetical protein
MPSSPTEIGKKGTRRLLVAMIAIGLVLAVLGAELVGNAIYFVRRGEMFYTRTQEAPNPGAYTTSQAVFHPYLAFIHRARRDGDWWTTNNMGFQVLSQLVKEDPACCDYPMRRREGEVLVGVFGGSVASGFALYAQKFPEFSAALNSIPQWQGKRVRILNFAMPGFKQPQQLIALAYYRSLGQHFDLVLNIDGFNEVVNTYRNWKSGSEPSFPADTLWGTWGRQLEGQAPDASDFGGERFEEAYYRIDAENSRRRA